MVRLRAVLFRFRFRRPYEWRLGAAAVRNAPLMELARHVPVANARLALVVWAVVAVAWRRNGG
jgi:hypothetical protein